MQLTGWSAQQGGAAFEIASHLRQRFAVQRGRDAACFGEKEEARRHVKDPDRDRRAEDVEASRACQRDRQGHRTQYADLGRALDERLGELERSGRALQAKELDPVAPGSLHDGQRLARAPHTLLADRPPFLACADVEDEARVRVFDNGTVEDGEHDTEQREPLLGVEAAVHRVDEDERVLGAEVAAAGLFGEHRELLTTLAKPRQLSEDNSLRGSVELQRRAVLPITGTEAGRAPSPMREKTSSHSPLA